MLLGLATVTRQKSYTAFYIWMFGHIVAIGALHPMATVFAWINIFKCFLVGLLSFLPTNHFGNEQMPLCSQKPLSLHGLTLFKCFLAGLFAIPFWNKHIHCSQICHQQHFSVHGTPHESVQDSKLSVGCLGRAGGDVELDEPMARAGKAGGYMWILDNSNIFSH